jgi:hypothetical protein
MGVAEDAEGQVRVKALQQGLRELGWIEGRNLRIDYRWTAGDAKRAQTYAAELVRLSPEAIVAHTPARHSGDAASIRLHSNRFCSSYRSRSPRLY